MLSLSQRSCESELLDNPDIPFEDIRQNMKELNTINTLLGGHRISIKGLQNFLPLAKKSRISVCEIGCGGGDNLRALINFCEQHNIKASFSGIDIKQACIDYAASQHPALPANWITGDYATLNLAEKPAVIFSSLFCHHFTESELVLMLRWMKENASEGFFINDLQRHPVAYYLIKWITKVFSKSYLVKNDAPLSVARALTRKEWEHIMEAAGLQTYKIQWKWAFRYLIVYKHERNDI